MDGKRPEVLLQHPILRLLKNLKNTNMTGKHKRQGHFFFGGGDGVGWGWGLFSNTDAV